MPKFTTYINSVKEMTQNDELIWWGDIEGDYQKVRDPELRQELLEIQNLLAQHRLDSQLSSYDQTTTTTGTSPTKRPQDNTQITEDTLMA